MKKTALALVLAVPLLLCACGEATVVEKEVKVEVPEVPEEYRKYQELVDTLESGDYDAALALIDNMAPEPVLPPMAEVQITTENFLDYFEYVELPEQNRTAETDAEGKVTVVNLNSGYYLKDGYTIARERAADCSLQVGLKYELHWFYEGRNIKTDLENVSYTITGKEGSVMPCDSLIRAQYVDYLKDTEPFYYIRVAGTRLADKNDATCLVPEENIELVSASGTLFLYE